jgi:alpha-amylase
MEGVRFILALHNHQPVGNFEEVFEATYRESYLPFLEVMEEFPAIPFVLHTSGPLLEWLASERPQYIDRLRARTDSGALEILGGALQEPILPGIPHRDRVGQIEACSRMLEGLFGRRPRGLWLPERVWEQSLTTALAEAGIEYTILDDHHFHRAGADPARLHGHYITEDQGRLLAVFPNSEPMRYLVPWQAPHESFLFLKRVAEHDPGSVVVCADDGEKFGGWPSTFEHVFRNGWLRNFCEMLAANRDWLRPTTLSEAVDNTLPRGKIYLPDCSYREMTEWALAHDRMHTYGQARAALDGSRGGDEAILRFFSPGGSWRNFKVRYPESDEMSARMIGVSNRLADLEKRLPPSAQPIERARQALYRSQCNCGYWHGAFGGLYLPHLRNAIYKNLILAHNALDEAEGRIGPRAEATLADYNLDARQEVCLENDHLIAFVRPALGGHLYELDCRRSQVNLLATLDRRPEVYHHAIAQTLSGRPGGDRLLEPENLRFKHEGLDRLLVYDRHPRKAFVDHFLDDRACLETLSRCDDLERGDFATGAFLGKVVREPGRVRVELDRTGLACGHPIRMRKTYELHDGQPWIEVHYVLDDLPPGVPLRFAVELNVAAMAGRADDRFFVDHQGARLGRLDSRLELGDSPGLRLRDEWLDLELSLDWSSPARLWCFPVETVSQSEGGYEGVYQSSVIMPHWLIHAPDDRRWEVTIRWSVAPVRESRDEPPPHRRQDAAHLAGALERVGLPCVG